MALTSAMAREQRKQRTIRPKLHLEWTGWRQGPRFLSYKTAIKFIRADFWIRIESKTYIFTGRTWNCVGQNCTIEEFELVLREKRNKGWNSRSGVTSAYVSPPRNGGVMERGIGQSAC